MMKIIEHKLVDMSDEVYYGDTSMITCSMLKEILKGPKNLLQYIKHIDKRESSESMDFGTAFHKYMLEYADFDESYAVIDLDKRPNPEKDFRDKENNNWKKELYMEIEASGKTGLDKASFQKIKAMTEVCYDTQAQHMITHGRNEIVYVAKIEIEGIQFDIKGKVDNVYSESVLDIKTSSKPVDKRSFIETINKYDYDMSAAWYMDLAMKQRSFLLAVETNEPFNVGFYEMSEETIERGRDKYIDALLLYNEYFAEFNINKINKHAFTGVI